MAGLSSKAASALKKALSRTLFRDLNNQVMTLENSIKGEDAFDRGREQEADRILSVEEYVDGSEIWPVGDLFGNLTRGLDESGLSSALTIVKSRMGELKAEEAAFIEKARLEHERTAPHLRFEPPVGRFDR